MRSIEAALDDKGHVPQRYLDTDSWRGKATKMKEQQRTILHISQDNNTYPTSKHSDLVPGVTVCALDDSEIFALSHRLLESCTALVVLWALVILVEPELRETGAENDFLAKQSCSRSIATINTAFIHMTMAHRYVVRIKVERNCEL